MLDMTDTMWPIDLSAMADVKVRPIDPVYVAFKATTEAIDELDDAQLGRVLRGVGALYDYEIIKKRSIVAVPVFRQASIRSVAPRQPAKVDHRSCSCHRAARSANRKAWWKSRRAHNSSQNRQPEKE